MPPASSNLCDWDTLKGFYHTRIWYAGRVGTVTELWARVLTPGEQTTICRKGQCMCLLRHVLMHWGEWEVKNQHWLGIVTEWPDHALSYDHQATTRPHIHSVCYEGNETYLETSPRLVLPVFWALSYKPALITISIYGVTLTLNIDSRVLLLYDQLHACPT